MFSFLFHRAFVPVLIVSFLIGGVAAVYANQVQNPSYVLPAFEALYQHGYIEPNSGSNPGLLHLQPVLMDINGDGLNDMVFQGNILEPAPNLDSFLGNYASRLDDYNIAIVFARGVNTLWRQRVRLNTGNGFQLVSKCEYSTQQEYESNCL
jgi:hypothetical protein